MVCSAGNPQSPMNSIPASPTALALCAYAGKHQPMIEIEEHFVALPALALFLQRRSGVGKIPGYKIKETGAGNLVGKGKIKRSDPVHLPHVGNSVVHREGSDVAEHGIEIPPTVMLPRLVAGHQHESWICFTARTRGQIKHET